MAPEVDVTMLIQEIQNRPAIYDTSKAEYHDRHLKRKMWEEVCCNVYSAPVWTCMTSKEKTKYVVENNESSIVIEQSAETLNVTLQSSDTGTTDCKRPKTQPKSKTNCYDEEYLEILREGNQLMKNNNLRHSESRTILGDMDEDESFLRSLLPYVKQFSSDQKLQLKIQLLQTVLNFKQSLSGSVSIHNQTQQVLDIPNERIVIVTDPSMNSNMSNQYDTAERPSTEPPNYSDIAEDSEYVPRPISLQNSSRPSGSSYTPSPVHRDYASIISPENESLFSLGDDDDVGEV